MSNPEGLVWYMAYGANLSTKVLVDRRQIKPYYALPCECSQLQLNFCAAGMPYFEPGFASVEFREYATDKEVPPLQGVAYLITRDDYKRIRQTEGGGGHDEFGYYDLNIDCNLYLGKNTSFNNSKALSNASLSVQQYIKSIESKLNQNIPVKVDCVTLKMHHNMFKRGLLPSQRYLNLLINGAKEHGMDIKYQQFLGNLPFYVPATMNQKIGKYALAALITPFFLSAGLVAIAFKRKSFAFNWYFYQLARLTWFTHDAVFKRVFGSGSQ